MTPQGRAANQWRCYLGDGAYVDFDGYHLVLTTENGIAITNTIALEPDVYQKLTEYVDRLKRDGVSSFTP